MALINLRNALMSGKRLPYDAEVEFLESDGTQYIDTGTVWESVTTAKIEATVQYTQTSGRQITCGAGTAFYFGCNANRWEWAYGRYTGTVGTGVHTVAKEISTTATDFYVDGALAATLAGSASQAWWGSSAYAFGLNNGGSFILPSTTRLYSLKIWIGDSLVFDGIPVRKGTTGELYDRVSGKFAERHGDFVLGPDVVPVEYIESSGTQHINTGIVPYPDMPLDISAYVSSSFPLIDARNYIFGSMRQGPGSTVWRCHLGLSPTDSMAFAGIGEVYADQAYPQLRNAWVRITQSQGKTLSANGIVLASSAESYDANLTAPIWLFGCCIYANYNSTVITERHGACRIGSAIVGNCSFRPVRVGNGSTWEGAMMDVLTRRIYRNAGTGAFGYGNDLKYPIPAE